MKKVLLIIVIALCIFQTVILATEWDVSTASYDSVAGDCTAETTSTIQGMFIKPDGTKLYIMHTTNDTIYQYTLSTAWLISSISYDSKSVAVTSTDTIPTDIFFKPDGTKMYVLGNSSDVVESWSLSTAWDISTATDDNSEIDFTAIESAPKGLFFKSDGTKMYIAGDSGNDVNQFTLSASWDVSSATSDSKVCDVSSEDGGPKQIFIKPDGTKMYILGFSNKNIFQYALSTAWDMSTGSYESKFKDVSSEESLIPHALFFKSDGTKMYVSGYSRSIHQYSMAAAEEEDNVIFFGTNF